MKLFNCEAYKLYVKRGLLIVFVLCLVFEVFLCVKNANAAKLTDREDQKKYDFYMSEFAGELTEEKQKKIEELIEQDAELASVKDNLDKQYIERKITEEEYEEGIKRYNELAVGRSGFNVFATDYQNVLDSGRCLIDQKPWTVLFGNESIDFAFVLFIILSVVLLSVYDEESGANSLTFPTENGKGRKWCSQFVLLILTAMLSSATVSIVKYLAVDMAYGLENGSFLLSNIEAFFGTSNELSLLGGYVTLLLVKMFGSIYMAILALFFGTVLKQSLLTFFTSFSVIFLPNYILPNREYKYLIPLPSAFLTANGYLYGDNIGDIVYFKALNVTQISVVASLAVIILTALATVSYFMTARRKSL